MRTSTLSNRFSMLVIVIIVVLGTSLSTLNLYSNYHSSIEAIDSAVANHFRETEAIASEAIYKLDRPIAQSLVNGSTANNYIVRSELYSDDGELLAQSISEPSDKIWRPIEIANKVVEHPISIRELGSQIDGKHVIEIDYESGMVKFYEQALTDTIIDFALIGSVSLAIYLVTLFYIARPVSQLARAVAESSPGEMPKYQPLLDRNDEIGTLAIQTYSYISKVHQYTEHIKADQLKRMELEEKLRHSQKMDAIGQLAGGIAHDFNNIMTVIMGNANLAHTYLTKGMTEKIEKSLDSIILSSERASKLTNQLLVFSRKDLSEPEPLDLTALIKQSAKMLERLITEDMHIIYDLNDVGAIIADENQIDLILINLTVNAKDALPDGGNITIHTSNVSRSNLKPQHQEHEHKGDYVLFRLTDNGIGIEQALQERIFDPFFTTKPVGKGTGLGLSTVYGIVSNCNGIIDIDSKVGEGTTINIYFPKVDDTIIKKTVAVEAGLVFEKPYKVLVCEDDENVRSYIVDLLDTTKLRFQATESPLEAIKMYRESPDFDLLITDIIMPELNGKELSDKLNEIAPLNSVFVSGYSENVISEKGIITENIHYLQKPFTQQGLFLAIKEAMNEV